MKKRTFLGLALAAAATSAARKVTKRIDHRLDEASAHSLSAKLTEHQKSVLGYLFATFDTVCLGDTNHTTAVFDYFLMNPELTQLIGSTPVFTEMGPSFQKKIVELQNGDISPGEFNTYCNQHGLNMWISKGREEKICFAMTDAINHEHLNLFGVDSREDTLPLRLEILMKISDSAINVPMEFFFPRSWAYGNGLMPGLLADSLTSYVAGKPLLNSIIQDKKTVENIKNYVNDPANKIIIAYGAGHFLDVKKDHAHTEMIEELLAMGRHPIIVNVYAGKDEFDRVIKKSLTLTFGMREKIPDVAIILSTSQHEQGSVVFFNDSIAKNYLSSAKDTRTIPQSANLIDNKL